MFLGQPTSPKQRHIALCSIQQSTTTTADTSAIKHHDNDGNDENGDNYDDNGDNDDQNGDTDDVNGDNDDEYGDNDENGDNDDVFTLSIAHLP